MKTSTSAFAPFAAALALCVLALAACRSPVQGGADSKSSLSLKFVVSGSSAAGPSSARLLLTTAKSLVAVLTPANLNNSSVQTRTASLSAGQGSVDLAFDSLPIGTYTLAADAYDGADGTGTRLFTQTSTFDVGVATTALTCNLVPAGADAVAATGAQFLSSASAVAAGAALTWRLSADSALASGNSLLLSGLGSGCEAFVQTLDGTQVAHGTGVSFLSTASAAKGQDLYLTFYNGGASGAVFTASSDPVMASVSSGSFVFDGTYSASAKAFSLGKYEVTSAQYYAVTGLATTANDQTPVVGISFYNALVFCNKLSVLEGLTPVYSIDGTTDTGSWIPADTDTTATADFNADGYRLPTEMEWWWAATGAGAYSYDAPYSGGTGSAADYAVYSPSAFQAVGTKNANALGLYDMSGGAWEYCWDFYAAGLPAGALSDYYGASGTNRVYRGGAWNTDFSTLPLDYRPLGVAGTSNLAGGGFRVARSVSSGYAPRNGLKVEYLFRDVSIARNTSSSSNSYDGTVNGSGTLVNLGADHHGTANAAYAFTGGVIDGSNVLLASLPLDGGTATPTLFTVSAWIYTTVSGTGIGQKIYDQGNSLATHTNLTFYLQSDNTLAYNCWPNTLGVNSYPSLATTSAKIPQNTWTHVAVVRSGAFQALYINGVLSASNSAAFTYSTGADAIVNAYIGQNDARDTNWDFFGSIDRFRLYDRALSAAEIAALAAE